MKNYTESIKAAPTDRVVQTNIDGMKNKLTDALYELGYDDTLVDPLIVRNVIDFSTVDYTSHIIDQLIEHYGDSIVWTHLEDAVAFEGLDISLTGELGRNWRSSKGNTFKSRIRDMIGAPIESLGLKAIDISELENHILTSQLDVVKRNTVIDYGEFGMHLPNVDIVIYIPENLRVIAVISCIVNLKNRIIDMAYWKLKFREAKRTAAIKYFLITTDLIVRSLAQTDLDCTYVLTNENLEETDNVKLFEHFIEDLKKVIEENR